MSVLLCLCCGGVRGHMNTASGTHKCAGPPSATSCSSWRGWTPRAPPPHLPPTSPQQQAVHRRRARPQERAVHPPPPIHSSPTPHAPLNPTPSNKLFIVAGLDPKSAQFAPKCKGVRGGARARLSQTEALLLPCVCSGAACGHCTPRAAGQGLRVLSAGTLSTHAAIRPVPPSARPSAGNRRLLVVPRRRPAVHQG